MFDKVNKICYNVKQFIIMGAHSVKKHSRLIVLYAVFVTAAVCVYFSFNEHKNVKPDNTQLELPNYKEQTNKGISFEYFYRGFTPFTEENSEEIFISGCFVFFTEEDWIDFAVKHCGYASFYESPDFSEYVLIADCGKFGSKPTANVLTEIDNIEVKDNAVVISYAKNSSAVYALNMNGAGHWAVNAVKVSRDSVPYDIKGVYRAGEN